MQIIIKRLEQTSSAFSPLKISQVSLISKAVFCSRAEREQVAFLFHITLIYISWISFCHLQSEWNKTAGEERKERILPQRWHSHRAEWHNFNISPGHYQHPALCKSRSLSADAPLSAIKFVLWRQLPQDIKSNKKVATAIGGFLRRHLWLWPHSLTQSKRDL